MRNPLHNERCAAPEAAPKICAADSKRRRFLLTFGAGAGAVAAVAGTLPGAVAAPVVAAVTPDAECGYRVTEHVRDYYRSTKI